MRELHGPDEAAAEAPTEASLDMDAEREARERGERLERLRAKVEGLFQGEALAGLRAEILESFDVPQFGEHHNEGMCMDTHLDLILDNIAAIRAGEFPDALREDVRATMRSVADAYGETLERYAFLHDLSKKDCLTVRKLDGTSEEPTWSAWKAGFSDGAHGDPVAVRKRCKADGVKSIGYFQVGNGKDGRKQHGLAARQALEGREEEVGVPTSVLTAIEKHEVAYQFTKPAARKYKEHLGGLSPEERDLALVASYVDTSASLRKDGRPDLSNFMTLVGSKRNFETIAEAERRLAADTGLDRRKVQTAIAKLMDLERGIEEGLDALVARLSKECAPTSYDPAKLEENFAALVRASVISEEEKAFVVASLAAGDLSAVGRRFGKRMAAVTPALKASES